MPAQIPFIEVIELRKSYGAHTVVDQVSFTAAEGEFLTFLGPSGCGKTTTLRCVAGFIQADGGMVRIAGKDMTRVPPHKRHLGMVFQNYALFPHLSVFDNVAFGLRIRGVGRAETASRVGRALEMVRLGRLGTRYPRQLSGGQQQRVALARALVYEPRVLLLDEPLSNLDAKLRVEMRSEIRGLQRQLGVTALYVTHDQEEALSISDRVMVMRQGRIEQLSTPWDIYNRPATPFVASFVGTSNMLPVRRIAGGLSLGAVRLPCAAEDIPRGEAFWLVARPEGLALGPATDEKPWAIRGEVQSVTMLGAAVRVQVEIAPSIHMLIDLSHNGAVPDIRAGDAVSVRFDPARLVFMPRQESNQDSWQPI
jgi:putative spermidine/putrescine transport system ATP-binding protein